MRAEIRKFLISFIRAMIAYLCLPVQKVINRVAVEVLDRIPFFVYL